MSSKRPTNIASSTELNKGVLKGKSIEQRFFNLHNVEKLDDVEFDDIKAERALGFKVANFLTQDQRDTIQSNFFSSPHLYLRADLDNHEYVGAYMARQPLMKFLENSAAMNPHLESMFKGTQNVMKSLIDKLTLMFSWKGITFRRAEYEGKEIAPWVIHNWSRNKNRENGQVIYPHDDLSLAVNPLLDGFEIQNVYSSFAINLCVENTDPSGGKLCFWNALPDVDEIKRNAKLFEYSPYDKVDLKQYDYREVKINSGDLYIFNGQFLHAVTDLRKNDDNRLGITMFCGYIDEKTIIYWE